MTSSSERALVKLADEQLVLDTRLTGKVAGDRRVAGPSHLRRGERRDASSERWL
jgi:hypothetical protein